MILKCKTLILCLSMLPAALGALEAPRVGERLAGEKEVNARPVSRQASVAPQEAGPVSLSRSSKPLVPTFKLPEFIVTGGGVSKAYSQRPKVRFEADTSGDFRVSPGEKNAGKDQIQAQGHKEGPQALTRAARPRVGMLEIVYGTKNSLQGSLLAGQEWSRSYLLVQGDANLSDGGEAFSLAAGRAPWNRRQGQLLAGWNIDSKQLLEFSASSRWRDVQDPFDAFSSPWMRRGNNSVGLNWSGEPWRRGRASVSAAWSDTRVTLPGRGLVRVEQGALFKTSASGRVDGYAWESGGQLAYRHEGASKISAGARDLILGRTWFLARVSPRRGSTLSLGLAVDWIEGDLNETQVSPQLHWEQRMGSKTSFFADFDPQMRLPSLSRDLLDWDTVLSNTALRPQREQLKLKVGVRRDLPYKVTVEAAGRLVQNLDHFILADANRDGFWMPQSAGRSRRSALDFRLRQALQRGFVQELQLVFQRLVLGDTKDLQAPFEPTWTAQWTLAWENKGPLGAALSLRARDKMALRLMKDPWASQLDNRPVSLDLGIKASYRLNSWLSAIAKADNLLAQNIENFTAYTVPAPFVGAGLKVQF